MPRGFFSEREFAAKAKNEELLIVVKKGITDAGAISPADFGKAMKILSPLLKGKASGSRIASSVKKELNQ